MEIINLTFKDMRKLLLLLLIVPLAASAADLSWRKVKLYNDSNEACAVEDFNNDGWLDISAGRNLFVAPDFVAQPLRDVGEFGVDYAANNGEHAFDVDGDGWLDLIAGSFMEREVYWYRNPGKDGLLRAKMWKKRLLEVTAEQNEITFFHNMTGDFTPEFVVNSWNQNNAMLFWNLTESGDEKGLNKNVVGSLNGHGIGFGDINGDGREDLLFQGGWYERPSDLESGKWVLHEDWLHKQAGCPMLVVDLNEDGRNDVIWGNGHDYGLFWEEQLKASDGKTQWMQHVIDRSWSQAHALLWEDIDGDGQEDLITGKRVRAHSGNDPGANDPSGLYYYTWDKGTRAFTRHTIDTGDAGTGLFIRAADLNRDSWKDLVVAGKSGTFIFYNEGR
jgi:hypothetical protein